MLFQIGALAVLVVFYGCYFGKLFAQRRRGIQTNQLGKGKTGLPKWIEIALRLTTVLVVLAETVCIVFDVTRFPVPVRILGLTLSVLGLVMFLLSVFTMRDNWRAGVSPSEKTELVTRGVYQISRNPAFLGFDLVYIGILLMFFHWGLFVLSVLAILLLHLQIVNVEEDFLLTAFGEEYRAYQQKVNRYLGRRSR